MKIVVEYIKISSTYSYKRDLAYKAKVRITDASTVLLP